MRGAGSPVPPSRAGLSSLGLEQLEPYVVAATVLAGGASLAGFDGGIVLPLTAVCWALFIANRMPSERRPAGQGLHSGDAQAWGLGVACAVTGLLLAVWAGLDGGSWARSNHGFSALEVAVLAGLGPSLILPPRAASARGLPAPWRRILRE